ncbi:lipoprotein-releasing ABC transporter permease subunit LolE [Thalassotalea marina]|uniref:Lipoprotein transporter subunit LolE n=1 Tax=Thalassotalea marina TaxID=1673741 RepID=A0A919EPC8_9GAMM|nr:lipoprotein-releasing ABC transporter permease subunit LolE [Thalassotalea marina]GHG03104.1 lipoprotein transporter subunit LolE [Thalassotalea marina]
MVKSLSLFIARRYISQKQLKGFTSFISASSTIGIAIGVMVLIVVLSAMNGFERALSQHLLSVVPHSELIALNQPFEDWQQESQRVMRHPQVIAAAPVIKMQGMMQHKDKLKGVEIRGVDVNLESNVSAIPLHIKTGSWQALTEPNSIILGQGIADKIGVSIGDKVQLLMPPMKQNNQVHSRFNAMGKRNFVVAGTFKFGGEIDNQQAFISLESAQQALDYQSNKTHGLRLAVSDVFAAPEVAKEAAYSLRNYVYIYHWTITQGHLYKDIQLVRMVMFIVLVLVIAVASFNIVSTLIMAVREKQGDIAILKTMGAKDATIMGVFMLQGFRNGVIGTVWGTLLGSVIAINLTEIFEFIEVLLGRKFLSGDIYFVDFIPTNVAVSDIAATACIALLLSVIATLYPAWKATKIDPAHVLGQM